MYYCCTIVPMMYYLKDADYMTWHVLGSNTGPLVLFKNFPAIEHPLVVNFYLANIGFRVYDTVDYFIYRFYDIDSSEKLVHHFLTLVLVLGSYSINYFPIGCVVLVLHDFSDFFIGMARSGMELSGSIMTLVFYFFFLSSWIWFRIYFFAFIVLPAFYSEAFKSGNEFVLKGFWPIFSFLCGLQALHVFWAYLIILGGYKRLRGQHKDFMKKQL